MRAEPLLKQAQKCGENVVLNQLERSMDYSGG